jgi:hypothetical protein
VSTIKELLERKVATPVCVAEKTAVGDSPRSPRDTPYPQKLALTPATSGGHTRGLSPRLSLLRKQHTVEYRGPTGCEPTIQLFEDYETVVLLTSEPTATIAKRADIMATPDTEAQYYLLSPSAKN